MGEMIMANCPSCNSGNTKKMQMVWASGTRVGRSNSSGVGVSSRGTVGMGVGRSNSSSQSHLAAACAPPKKSKMPFYVILILSFVLWMPMFNVVISSLTEGSFLSVIFGLPVLGLISFGLFKLYVYLGKKNQQEIEAYNRTWVCLKCGANYE